MNETVFQTTPDYSLHVKVGPVVSPKKHLHVLIESQWLGAKNPAGRQTVFDRTLSCDRLLSLGQFFVNEAIKAELKKEPTR